MLLVKKLCFHTIILAVTLKSVEFSLEAKQILTGQNRREGRPPKTTKALQKQSKNNSKNILEEKKLKKLNKNFEAV